MRKLLLLLGVLGCCAATAAIAGPNAGGVLWAHDTGISVTSDPIVWPAKPADCLEVDSTMPLWDGAAPPTAVSRYWKVYAAFPSGSSPRLKTVGWKTVFPDAVASPHSYVAVTSGVIPDEDGAGTDFFIGDQGFPLADGGTIGQSFPTGPRTTLVTTLFIFAGYGYNDGTAPPTWCTAEKPGDNLFGDDQIPATTDPVAGYGCLGFGASGFTPCPDAPAPTGACCDFATGNCTITTQTACGFSWLGSGVPCDVQTCPSPDPSGACCDFATGACTITTQTACGYSWLGAGTACTTITCPVPAPEGACCFANGDCTLTTEANCTGTVWLVGRICSPNPCDQPVPVGACCNILTGECTITSEADCLAPLVWRGANTPCNLEPCMPGVPTKRSSWGQIKNIYR